MVLRILVLLAMLASSAGVLAVETEVSKAMPLVGESLLAKAGIKQVFQVSLAIKDTESLEQFLPLGDNLYALSSTNYLFCVDRKNGRVVFAGQLTEPGFPVFEPKVYNGKIFAASGSELITIDIATAALSRTKSEFRSACSPARTSNYIYIAGVDKRLHALQIEPQVRLFDAAADNDSLMTSIIANGQSVIMATLAGNVVSIKPDSPSKIWQRDLPGKITAAMVLDANSIYVSCEDTYLYKIKLTTGQIEWKAQLAGALTNSAAVGSTAVYQYVVGRGLTAIDKATGAILWQMADGVAMLAQTAEKSYVMSGGRNCVVMDNGTGKEIERINFAQTQLQMSNGIDSKMYVADKQGRVACYEPVKN